MNLSAFLGTGFKNAVVFSKNFHGKFLLANACPEGKITRLGRGGPITL
jgi:hypothetical protein